MRCIDCFEVFSHPGKTTRKTRMCAICRGIASKLKQKEPSERTVTKFERKSVISSNREVYAS